MTRNYEWRFLALISLLSCAMSIFCFEQMYPRIGVPEKGSLLQSVGKVVWVKEYRYGTRFGLTGTGAWFVYPSKATGTGSVRDALISSPSDDVSVLYESETHGPIYSSDRYHDVWELTIGGRAIRTYEQSAAAWELDNRLIPWLGAAMGLCAIVLGHGAWKARRAARRRATGEDLSTRLRRRV